MMASLNVAVYGAFMMNGARDRDPELNNLMDKWAKGCIEFVTELTSHVELVDQLVDGAAPWVDFPGVYEYEVVESFGFWFANKVMQSPTGDAPAKEECKTWLIDETIFFFQKEADDVLRAHIEEYFNRQR